MMSTHAASMLGDRQHSIASLADRVHSLPRRFAVSQASMNPEAAQLALTAASCCAHASGRMAKSLEIDAEEARVRAAQLQAYVLLLEWEAEDGKEATMVRVAAAARALLSYSAAAGCPTVPSPRCCTGEAEMAWWRRLSHRLCDGMGPTLVLIRCDKGFVFWRVCGRQLGVPSKQGNETRKER